MVSSVAAIFDFSTKPLCFFLWIQIFQLFHDKQLFSQIAFVVLFDLCTSAMK